MCKSCAMRILHIGYRRCRLARALEIKIKNLLININFIALTTNCWTSVNFQLFIAVTAHFIDVIKCT